MTRYPGLRKDSDQAQLGRWEVGPIEVADTDLVSVNYGLVNAMHTLSHGGDGQTSIAIGLASWATLVGIGAAAGGVAGAVVTAIAAGVAAVAGLLLKDVPNCDGVVGGNKRLFTGTQLKQATNNPQRVVVFDDESGNPTAPDGCGASDVVLTFSITFLPFYSVKNFMIAKWFSDWSGPWTVKFLQSTKFMNPRVCKRPLTSVRYIIENYEALIIS